MRLAALSSLMLALALGGCGGGRDRTVATGTVDDGNGGRLEYATRRHPDGTTTTTVRSADGTAEIHTGDVAAALPPGLALYPGARPTSNIAVSQRGADEGTVLAFESADAPDRIVAFYRAAAQHAGYSVQSEMAAGTMAMIAGKRTGDGHGFTLTVNRTGDKSEATLIGGR